MKDMDFISKIYKIIPKSLIARFALIICIPMILCQVIAVYIFYERHWSNVASQNSRVIASQIELVVEELKSGDLTNVVKYTKLFKISLENINELPITKGKKERNEIQILRKYLKNIPSFINLIHKKHKIKLFFGHIEGNYVKMTIPEKPLVNPISEIFVYWIIFISIFFIVISLIFAKNQIKSIEELSYAANKLGSGEGNRFKFTPSGALEIRNAGFALLKMQNRLERQVKKRLHMLAMISHDLRTPLTRMLLQIELAGDNEFNAYLKNDLDSMKHMIDSYLDFARGEKAEEFKSVEIGEWLKEYFEKSRLQSTNLVMNESKFYFKIKPFAFRRAISNIISNAEKYSTKSSVSYNVDDKNLNIYIEDNGKGINLEEQNLVFKAFYRSEKGRKVDKYGSVGLGLSIAKEIILNHMGEIKIDNSKKLGGAKIIIKLPIEVKNLKI